MLKQPVLKHPALLPTILLGLQHAKKPGLARIEIFQIRSTT